MESVEPMSLILKGLTGREEQHAGLQALVHDAGISRYELLD